jgi:HK97 family phage major capsid protein
VADISRAEVATLIQEEYSNTLLEKAEVASAVLTAFGSTPLGTKITNAPVLATLPEAQWVGESATADEGKKPTSQATWANKQFVVEEVAVIVPIHEDVLEDATDDLVESITAAGGTALGKKLDQAVIFGTDKPVTWTSNDLLAAAIAAGNDFEIDLTPGEDDLLGAILQAAGAVADSGADPSVLLSAAGLRWRLSNLRDGEGGKILQSTASPTGLVADDVAGLRAAWVKNGAWEADEATAIVADRDRVKIGVRQDVTVKFLDQATVGGINLAERDMVAFRFKARYAYVLGNTITGTGVAAEPVGAVLPASGS